VTRDPSASLPTISVITPSFNQGQFIERTIRSVLDQQYPALEYHVFDGGSTDQTLTILRRYSDKLRWHSEEDRGQADAVNKGLRVASGEIIGWLNSDDIYYPGALATVAARFKADPAVDLVYSAANHIDAADQVIAPYPTEPWDLARFCETCFFCQPAVFFRRSVVERWGYLDDRLHYCMDYEYWLRLALGGARFFYEPLVLAGSRVHPETKTLAHRVRSHAEINDVVRSKLGKTTCPWIIAYAHYVVEEAFGIPPSRRKYHRPITALMVLYTSIRWNRRISPDVRDYVRHLMREAVH
jgi:glycosyltransferase involved in cell wall biosynthesis